MKMRLQKKLAEAGIASRRGAVEIITSGKVKVNGNVILEPGFDVKENDLVMIEDKVLEKEKHVYYLMNKPTGVVTTVKDEKNRKTVIDLLDEVDKRYRVFPVGRLDFDTAGLLLLTNDGNLNYYLTKPDFGVRKTYLARVEGLVNKHIIRQLKSGVKIENNYLTKKAEARLEEVKVKENSSLVRITITEGKNRQVRQMFEALGYPVKNLTRIEYDFLTLDGVQRGSYRELSIHEVKKLYAHTKKTKI
ncbi:MAG TPA: pseudouridine synthase [Acholeplasmataceae bacterium]|nr:pseudouridine synthase [Acholeplasmataceae bacterium]